MNWFDIPRNIGYICDTKYRGVEQLVARRAHNPKVVGSSPAPATIITEEILIVKNSRDFLFLKYI